MGEITAFILYFVIVIAIGIYFFAKSKDTSGEKDYFLGGRQMGPWVAAMSAQASDMSAWLLMGLPGSILAFGMGKAWIGIGLAITFAAGIIDGICRPAKIPVVAGEEGICKACGTVTLSINYKDLGYATGLMAARILADGEDISTMPIEYAPKFTKKYNDQICEELGIEVPSDYEAI